jgi:hypothetical protein
MPNSTTKDTDTILNSLSPEDAAVVRVLANTIKGAVDVHGDLGVKALAVAVFESGIDRHQFAHEG